MNNELYHFNPNHDKLGRFSKSSGGGGAGGKILGLRKTVSQKRKASKKIASERAASKKQKATDVKNRRTMSDSELKKKVERLEMEKKLSSLTSENLSPGRTFVKKVITSATEKALTTAVSGAELYLLKYATGTKEFDRDAFAEAMFNGGAKKK